MHFFIKSFLVLVSFAAASLAHQIIEGDILLDKETLAIMRGRSEAFDARKDRTWPNAVIPYAFDSRIDTLRRELVKEAVVEFAKYTCVKFIPRTTQRDYVRFWFGPDCSSYVGRKMYSQDISLGKGCAKKGIIMHELMHAIGFFHEQSRLDRDDYVRIVWENIVGGWQENFQKYSHGEADYLGEPYDYSSLMHYPGNAFSRNGKHTIVPLKLVEGELGQRDGFSTIDVRQINKLYRCGNVLPTLPVLTGTLGTVKSTTETFTSIPGCSDNNAKCSTWANMGECWRNPDFMLQNCKHSCNACGNVCLDFKIRCKYLADIGECTKNAAFMKQFCRKSCNMCTY